MTAIAWRRRLTLGLSLALAASNASAQPVKVGAPAPKLDLPSLAGGRVKLATLAGGKVKRADADTVKQATGYAIGGVPPLAHDTALPIWIDEDLLRHELIYAAAGVPECVFPLTPDDLLRVTGGRVADVKESKPSLKGEPA